MLSKKSFKSLLTPTKRVEFSPISLSKETQQLTTAPALLEEDSPPMITVTDGDITQDVEFGIAGPSKDVNPVHPHCSLFRGGRESKSSHKPIFIMLSSSFAAHQFKIMFKLSLRGLTLRFIFSMSSRLRSRKPFFLNIRPMISTSPVQLLISLVYPTTTKSLINLPRLTALTI